MDWAAPFRAEIDLATQRLRSSAAVDSAVADEFAPTEEGTAADIASMAVTNITLPPGYASHNAWHGWCVTFVVRVCDTALKRVPEQLVCAFSLTLDMAPRQPSPVLSYANGSCGDFYSSTRVLAAERIRSLPIKATFVQCQCCSFLAF